jgi:hypothetical protein
MKGIITIKLKDEIGIYVKASNLQGTMEGTVVRKNWNEVLNQDIVIDYGRITIRHYIFNESESELKIKMDLYKDTGMFHFDLKLTHLGESTYSADLGGPDLFTWPSLILHIILTPIILPLSIIYNKLVA